MMHDSSRPRRSAPPSCRRTRFAKAILAAAAGVSAFGLAACSSAPELSEERVTRSETIVQEAEQTVGGSESGAVELQKAKEKLAAAREALDAERPVEAERLGLQAQLHAELAIARTQSAAARHAADEMLASVETLRKEAERNSPALR